MQATRSCRTASHFGPDCEVCLERIPIAAARKSFVRMAILMGYSFDDAYACAGGTCKALLRTTWTFRLRETQPSPGLSSWARLPTFATRCRTSCSFNLKSWDFDVHFAQARLGWAPHLAMGPCTRMMWQSCSTGLEMSPYRAVGRRVTLIWTQCCASIPARIVELSVGVDACSWCMVWSIWWR